MVLPYVYDYSKTLHLANITRIHVFEKNAKFGGIVTNEAEQSLTFILDKNVTQDFEYVIEVYGKCLRQLVP